MSASRSGSQDEPEQEQEHDTHTAPVTGADVRRAIEYMARVRHLSDQSDAAARTLGGLVGAFMVGATSAGASEDGALDMAHHFLETLLPPTPDDA